MGDLARQKFEAHETLKMQLRLNSEGTFELIKPLTVQLVASLKGDKKRFLSKREAANFLGASETVFKEMQKSGVLQPRTGGEQWGRKGYDAVHLKSVLEKLFAGTEVMHEVPEGMARLPKATRIAKCSSPEIVRLILSERLKAVGRIGESLELNNLVVSCEELAKALPKAVRNGFTKTELSKRWSMSVLSLNKMIENGDLRQVRMKHSLSRMTGMLVPTEDVEAYECRLKVSKSF